jgi:hypothetical protein
MAYDDQRPLSRFFVVRPSETVCRALPLGLGRRPEIIAAGAQYEQQPIELSRSCSVVVEAQIGPEEEMAPQSVNPRCLVRFPTNILAPMRMKSTSVDVVLGMVVEPATFPRSGCVQTRVSHLDRGCGEVGLNTVAMVVVLATISSNTGSIARQVGMVIFAALATGRDGPSPRRRPRWSPAQQQQ